MSSWSVVTVGVADLNAALKLWQDDFGLEVAERREGPDAELAQFWNIDSDDIAGQALVKTPGIDFGMLHLVEFVNPQAPVREAARAYDLCPKNLDIYTDDMPTRMTDLRARGREFSNEDFSEVTAPNGVTFREIHMPSHDRINIVLLELMGEELPVSTAGFSGVGILISIVPKADTEKAFYRNVMGLDLLSDNLLKGPEIEKMVGLPTGAALDVSIWGKADNQFGRMEIIEYQGVRGDNLYPKTTPKSRGILHVSYFTNDLGGLKKTLETHEINFELIEHGATLYSRGPTIFFQSPAGMRIYVSEQSAPWR